MKGRWKWVFLILGVLLISATCGFGYQAKLTRTQFEEAADALEHRDWDRLAANLPPPRGQYAPSNATIAKFLNAYMSGPERGADWQFKHETVKSEVVPIPNETVEFTRQGLTRRVIVMSLTYTDDMAWFSIPMSTKQYGIFQGKRIRFYFPVVFFRAAYLAYPPRTQNGRWQSMLKFVRKEKANLDAMGLKPAHIYSPAKTWDEYLSAMEKQDPTRTR